jgi:hypothetical protein
MSFQNSGQSKQNVLPKGKPKTKAAKPKKATKMKKG